MKKLLKDKRVLYFVLFLALTNLFHFLFAQDYNALTLFIVLGLLTSHFSKNMIIVLTVSMLVTHLFRRNLLEGMQNKEKDEKKDKKEKHEEDDENKEALTEKKDANKKTYKHKGSGWKDDGNHTDDESDNEENFSSGRIDQASTVENAYDNLNQMVGKDGIKNLTKETAMLIDQQKDLVSTMKSITPVLKDAMSLMNSDTFKGMATGLDMKKMQSQLSNLMGKKAPQNKEESS